MANAPQSARPQPQRDAGPITLGEVAQDLAMLVTNLKEDSDILRARTLPLTTVSEELNRMNVVLSAIPAMAVDMHRMNLSMGLMTQSMGVMTQSVGSTMGRMGSMWPF
jgi:hypothetical protein